MNKLEELATILFGNGESNGQQPPISRFLEQMWRRSGRANPGSSDPEKREGFVFWYILHFYSRSGHQWPLPPALETWLNAPAVDVSQEIREAPGLRSSRPNAEPKYLSRYMQHVWKTEAKRFDVKAMEGFFDFLAWYAFRFMPEHRIPPALLPHALVEQLNRAADNEQLPLTTGMLVFEKLERPDRFQRMLEAPDAKLYAICFELARDVLATGNPRLVPAFVSGFWRSAHGGGETAFDYVTSLVDARHAERSGGNSYTSRLPTELPLAYLFSTLEAVEKPIQKLAPTRPRGLSIVSYRDHNTVCGLAKAGGYAIESLRGTGIETIDLDYNIGRKDLKQEALYNGRIFNNSLRNIHVFNLNPEHVLDCVMCNLSRIRENDYFIGQFYWELSDVCAIHEPTLSLMNEIWVASEFLASVYRRRVGIPVVNMGAVVSPSPSPQAYTRADFGLREGDYLFLVNFDASSIVERKNPLAAVAAFQEAFPQGDEKAGLIIKTRNLANIGPSADRKHWETSAHRIEKDRRIRVIDATFPEDAMTELYRVTDCYVSLHRSEGFGYGPAEAMYWGKPAIVTAFSGVCDFCTESTARLVDYELIAVQPKEYPYVDSEGTHFWADPNVGTASRHMRLLYEDPQSGVNLGKQGQRLIRDRYSPRALSQRYSERLNQLGFVSVP
jgi:glycosyltransferase involved in cell wall biosynthesis